jgi:hypothetical protein
LESEREKMSKKIQKYDSFETDFKKPEFSRHQQSEIKEALYSDEEESLRNTEAAKTQVLMNVS